MPDPSSQAEHVGDVDTALLDAELFIKYNRPNEPSATPYGARGHPSFHSPRERLREVVLSITERRGRAAVFGVSELVYRERGFRQCL